LSERRFDAILALWLKGTCSGWLHKYHEGTPPIIWLNAQYITAWDVRQYKDDSMASEPA